MDPCQVNDVTIAIRTTDMWRVVVQQRRQSMSALAENKRLKHTRLSLHTPESRPERWCNDNGGAFCSFASRASTFSKGNKQEMSRWSHSRKEKKENQIKRERKRYQHLHTKKTRQTDVLKRNW